LGVAAPGLLVVLIAALIGYGVSHDPVPAFGGVGLVLLLTVTGLAGLDRLTVIVLAALPWMVLLIDLTPRLTLTLTAAFAALLLLLRSPRFGEEKHDFPWLAAWLFALAVLAQAAQSTTSNQLIEAAKYSLFPAMALLVASPTSRTRLVTMRNALLGSGVAAMAADGLAIVLHVGRIGSYYGVGEQLGLTAESPHEIALLGVMVAIACLLTVRDVRWRILGAAISATPALATGVRSPLVALVVSLLVVMVRARFRPSMLLSVAVIAGAVIFSGVGSIIATRYAHSQVTGEYASINSAGSGRGGIWEASVDTWIRSGPLRVAFGDGLNAVERITQQRLQNTVTAQSDVVAMLVELGLLGLVAWLAVWLAIVRSKVNWLVLLPLVSYAVTNGALQYVGAVVFGIALAGACGTTPNPTLPRLPGLAKRYGTADQ
jgi:O-antigen ligase